MIIRSIVQTKLLEPTGCFMLFQAIVRAKCNGYCHSCITNQILLSMSACSSQFISCVQCTKLREDYVVFLCYAQWAYSIAWWKCIAFLNNPPCYCVVYMFVSMVLLAPIFTNISRALNSVKSNSLLADKIHSS